MPSSQKLQQMDKEDGSLSALVKEIWRMARSRCASAKGKHVRHRSTEFIVIRVRPNVTDNGFVYYLAKWDEIRQYCISQMTGSSGRERVPSSALSHHEVTIPQLNE